MSAAHTDMSAKDVVSQIVANVKSATTAEAQRNAAAAINRETESHRMTDLFVEAGVVSALTTALCDWDDTTAKEECVWAVSHLCNRDPEVMTAFVQEGILDPLVSFLSHIDSDGDSTAAWVLLFLTQTHSEIAQKLRDVTGVLEALEKVLVADKSGRASALHMCLLALEPSGRYVKSARA